MRDIYGIIGCYDEGMEAKKEKNYLQAARCFRMCRYYYEYGELNFYFSHVEKRAKESYRLYVRCKSKLTKEAQYMLYIEEAEFRGCWRDFVKFDQQKIMEEKDSPSPNKSKKKKGKYSEISEEHWEIIKRMRKAMEENENLTDDDLERKYNISVPGMLSSEWGD